MLGATGYWLLAASCKLQVASCKLQVFDVWNIEFTAFNLLF